jgi:hypothetical protein
MLSINPRHSVVTLAVTAGLLAAAVPASAGTGIQTQGGDMRPWTVTHDPVAGTADDQTALSLRISWRQPNPRREQEFQPTTDDQAAAALRTGFLSNSLTGSISSSGAALETIARKQ